MLRLSYFSRENHLRALLMAWAAFLAASLLMVAVADPAHARNGLPVLPRSFVSPDHSPPPAAARFGGADARVVSPPPDRTAPAE